MENIKQLVAFCILMENNGGIVNKAPGYVIEKFNACKNLNNNPDVLLDCFNKAKYDKYMKTWRVEK